MFGDGKINVIRDEDNDLYINMWELTMHLINSARLMYEQKNEQANTIADTMRVLASTISDLALFELGKDTLKDVDSLADVIQLWETERG